MRIGQVEIDSQLALAPMAGVTDAAYRQICSELGAGLTSWISIWVVRWARWSPAVTAQL